MQRDREVREADRQLDSFGSIFGGKDPFDDPFFSHPHGSLFDSDTNHGNVQPKSRSKGPVIEELDSDAEVDEENAVDSATWANRNPLVEHPEDEGNGRQMLLCADNCPYMTDHGTNGIRGVSSTTNHNKVEARKPQSRSVSFQRVTYGGINGAYYTATTSRRAGNDGVTWEESKQADRTTGQATHKVSRGIHDKGHSVTRKLDSDGKVDTMQSLQNLNEDELEGFEQAWGGIAGSHFHGWNGAFDFPRISGPRSNRLGPVGSQGGFLDPLREHLSRSSNQNLQRQSTSGRPKKVVTINIE
ncbi:hypothetical protein C2S51_004554 [Perilla frutescens var. frutescens]|nr:hypothetical protein C2S51_004554 [Perilla frutescens var. frutescens]